MFYMINKLARVEVSSTLISLIFYIFKIIYYVLVAPNGFVPPKTLALEALVACIYC